MDLALGLIETKGLIGAIEAADAMAKAADVRIVNREKSTAALITIKIVGDVAAVKAAVDAGAVAAQRVGQLVSAHVIPRPHDDIDLLINSSSKVMAKGDDPYIIKPHRKRKKKEEENTFFDTEQKASEEIKEVQLELGEEKEEIIDESEEESIAEEIDEAIIPAVIVPEGDIEEEELSESEDEIISEEPEIEVMEEEVLPEEEEEEIEELFGYDDEIVAEEETAEEPEESEEEEEPDTLSRLRAEAFEELTRMEESFEKEDAIPDSDEEIEEEEISKYDLDLPSPEELDQMNVHDLRKLARSIEVFPIRGRDISKANKGILLEYFQRLR